MTYTGATFPIDKPRITLKFAATEKPYSQSNKHKGVDLAPFPGSTGQPVYMPWRGVMIAKGYHATAGNYLIANVSFPFELWADDLQEATQPIRAGANVQLHFYHLKDMYAKTGDAIREGTIIGTIGNTGHSFGPHLHFEARINNPANRHVVNPIHLLVATIPGLKEQLI